MIDLVVTDLDGTLWGPEEVIHPRSLSALRQVEQRGVPILVATGRSRRLAYPILAQHEVTLDAALHDGALGATTTGELFHHQPFDEGGLKRLLDTFGRVGLEPILEVDHPEVDFIVGERPNISRPLSRPVLVTDLSQPLPMPVFRAIAVVEADSVQPLMAELLESEAGEAWAATSQFGDDFWLIVRPMACSKWSATLSYCARVGADPKRVLAIGDGHNDRELLAQAHVSVAVQGASEAVLALADHVIEAPTRGGWAEVLDLL